MGKRTSQLGEITTVDNNDILYGVDVDDLTHSPDGTSVKFKKSNLLKEVVQGISDNAGDISDIQTDVGEINDQITDIYSAIAQGYTGWNPITAGCTYQGADAPSYSMYIEGNANLFLTLGMRILLTNGGSPKMFILTLIGSYDAGNDRTLLTMYGGTDYTLANSAITNVYFSPYKVPFGFPIQREKWTVFKIDTTQRRKTNPVDGTYYYTDLGSINIVVPVGSWELDFTVGARAIANTNTAIQLWAGLSTSTSSFSDNYLTSWTAVTGTSDMHVVRRNKSLTLTSKTTYYLVGRTSQASGSLLGFENDMVTCIIRATCAYL